MDLPLLLLPLTVHQVATHNLANFSAGVWVAIVFLTLFPSVVAYLIDSWALKHVAASHLAAFAYLQPLLATALAAVMLHEAVSPVLLLAGLLILKGVVVTERSLEV